MNDDKIKCVTKLVSMDSNVLSEIGAIRHGLLVCMLLNNIKNTATHQKSLETRNYEMLNISHGDVDDRKRISGLDS